MRGVLMLRALGDYGRLMVFPSQLHIERTVFEPGPEDAVQRAGAALSRSTPFPLAV